MAEQLAGSVALRRRVRAAARRPASWFELMRFALVGASGYVVNLAVFFVAVNVLDATHIGAALLAFAVAVLNNFWWNRHWTFKAPDGHAGFQAVRFFAVSVAALALNLVLLEVLVTSVGTPELAAQAVAIACATPVSFMGNKLWTFG